MKKLRDATLIINPDYQQFIEELKARVVSARITVARAITHEEILLYWDIGQSIVEKQQFHSWGDSIVEMVAADLQEAFPGMRGFSPDSVWRMRQFYSEYAAPSFLEQPVPETAGKPVALRHNQFLEQLVQEILPAVPWGHHIELLKKVKAPPAKLWYLRATARFGWSRNVLLNQIKGGAYERAVTEKKTHNFDLALPEHFAEQADEMLKSYFYLNLLNDKERGPGDHPSIGIILCAEKDDVEVEYALRSKANPIGVAAYQLQSKLPGELKGKLPTAKQLADIVRVEMEGGK